MSSDNTDDRNTVFVFAVRGVYLFRIDRTLSPVLESRYNESEDRYEVVSRNQLSELPNELDVKIIENSAVEAYQVVFHGNAPDSLVEAALLVEKSPNDVTLLLPNPDLVERAVEVGGEQGG
jgi:hypothetical protein